MVEYKMPLKSEDLMEPSSRLTEDISWLSCCFRQSEEGQILLGVFMSDDSSNVFERQD